MAIDPNAPCEGCEKRRQVMIDVFNQIKSRMGPFGAKSLDALFKPPPITEKESEKTDQQKKGNNS
jgi:hypothetical protein